MKRKWIISLTLALLLSPSLSLQAQSLMDRMAKKAAEQREAQQQIRMQNMLSKMGMSGEPVRFNDSYTFDTSVRMHIKTLKKNGKVGSEGDMISYLNASQNCSAFEFVSGNLEMKDGPKNKGLFIMDQDNKNTSSPI